MSFKILYHPEIASRDLPLINKNLQGRIRKAIEERLLTDPIHFGAPLRQSLRGYRKLRVGDYRVIYELIGIEIRVYAIGHRKEIYTQRLRKWNS